MSNSTEALIYARYSKADQSKGHSIQRQLDNTREVCRARDLIEAPNRVYVEKGKSAFTGANRAKGSLLANLELEIAAGVHIGRTLVVEHLDRISRQGHDEVTAFLRTCSANGVTVATWDGSRVYRAGEPIPMIEIIEIILKAELAREESDKKSRRVRASFKDKRQDASAGKAKAIASRPPSWLRRVPGGYDVIEDRAEIVREAHRLAANGAGTPEIVKIFNGRGIPTWRNSSRGWHESYVARMLTNRAAIGEYHSPTHGDRILDYYPPVVTVELFNRVQASREKRRVKGVGRRGNQQSNLFGGLTMCADCGGRMYIKPRRRVGKTYNRKSRKGVRAPSVQTVTASYLECRNAKQKVHDNDGNRVCTNVRSVRYEYLEPAILDQVFALAMTDERYNVTALSKTRIALAEVERQIEGKTAQAHMLAENLKGRVSTILMDQLNALEVEIEERSKERDSLRRALNREGGDAPTAEMVERVREAREAMQSPNEEVRREARIRASDALKGIVTSIQCDERAHSIVAIAQGLAAFEIDATGKIVATWDGSGDAGIVRALTSGELRGNRGIVNDVLRAAKCVNAH